MNINNDATKNTPIAQESIIEDVFEDLAPKADCSKSDTDIYERALSWALNNNRVKNIALAGAYGSGKSSIIETFIDRNKNNKGFKFLKVSLASFSNKQKDFLEKIEVDEKLVEFSILQQIFYHAKSSDIPDSRFSRIKGLKSWHIGVLSGCIILYILAWFVLLDIVYLFPKDRIISFILVVLISGHIIAQIIRKCKNLKFKKISIQNCGMELNDGDTPSILNKHLDEILYFFKNTKHNVLIIEDLDRIQGSVELLTKLRELNIVINNSEYVGKRVIFIYAIRDDIFEGKDREKFFDFIIPIIPVINPSNSGDILYTKLKIEVDSGTISKDFIGDISLFIDDMRLLKNICNEYHIYKQKLGNDLDQNNLLAMIIYKNIFPLDFMQLHNNEGDVNKIFAKKQELIKTYNQDIDQQISKIKQQIELINKETLTDITELRAIYINAFRNKFPNAVALYINNERCSFEKIMIDNDLFKLFETWNNIQYYYATKDRWNNYTETEKDSGISFTNVEKLVSENKNYAEREQYIKNKVNGKINDLKAKIEKLNREKQEAKYWTVAQLAEAINISNSFESEEGTGKDLLIYMLKNGYINEYYYDYISIFHEGLLTRSDNTFLRAVRSQKPLEYEFKLSSYDNLIKRINQKEWEEGEVLNFGLFDFLLEHKYDLQLNTLLTRLSDESENSLTFIDEFITQGKNIGEFITLLCKKWSNIWRYIKDESNFSEEKQHNYLSLILKFADIDDIENIAEESNLTDDLSEIRDFHITYSGEIFVEKLKNVLERLDVHFKSLSPVSGHENKLLEFIIEKNLYVLTSENIRAIIQYKNFEIELRKFDESNYTTIIHSQCPALIDYIHENIDEYISDVYLKLDSNNQDAEESIINLLNNEEITLENKKEIVKKWNGKIKDIDRIKDSDLWSELLATNKISTDWRNVINYFEKKGSMDDILVHYLSSEKNYALLSTIDMGISSEDLKKKISIAFLSENRFNMKCYISFARNLPIKYHSWSYLNTNHLSKDKKEWLISNAFLTLTKSIYNDLKNNHSNLHIKLLERNTKDFLKSFEDYDVDGADLRMILQSRIFTKKQKINIITRCDKTLIIEDRDLSNVVCSILSKTSYLEFEEEILISLIKNGEIEDKIRLLNIQFDHVSRDTIMKLLTAAGWPYSDIPRRRRPKLAITQYNRTLAENLKNKRYISSYNPNNLMIHTKRK